MDVIDLIYEAAWLPEVWPRALAALAQTGGSAQASMHVFPQGAPPLVQRHGVPDEVHAAFVAGAWSASPSVTWALRNGHSAFTSPATAFSREDLARDPAMVILYERGFGDSVTSVLSLPDGDRAGFMLARWARDGDFSSVDLSRLDRLRPHLVRSVLISARLRLEAARNSVEALERLGLAAAVVSPGGRVVVANRLMDRLNDVFVATAFGGVALSGRLNGERFAAALGRILTGESAAETIPVRANPAGPALLLHMLPVRGGARDLFAGGEALMVVSPVTRRAAPRPEILHGLFDLTPAEARLVGRLAEGGGLPDAARDLGLSVHTVRMQLRSVMGKTGVHRQSELLQLVSRL